MRNLIAFAFVSLLATMFAVEASAEAWDVQRIGGESVGSVDILDYGDGTYGWSVPGGGGYFLGDGTMTLWGEPIGTWSRWPSGKIRVHFDDVLPPGMPHTYFVVPPGSAVSGSDGESVVPAPAPLPKLPNPFEVVVEEFGMAR